MTLKSKFYDMYVARHYDAEMEPYTEAARQLCVEQLQLQPGATVVDLGCGTGLNLPHLAAAVGAHGRVLALDASTKMLEQAEVRLRDAGFADRVTLVHGDARRLREVLQPELADSSVDALLITLFLSVVPDWRAVFDQAFGLLTPGGRCVVLDAYSPKPSLRLRWLNWRYAADMTRPTHEPLREAASDFYTEELPPMLYLASGTKP